MATTYKIIQVDDDGTGTVTEKNTFITEGSLISGVTGAFTASVTVQYTVIGNFMNVFWPEFSATATFTDYLILDDNLPAALRPLGEMRKRISVQNNGSNVVGVFSIDINGNLLWGAGNGPTATFTSGGTATVYSDSISYPLWSPPE